jgi:tetratricopeptide (TPR) repeat protein
MSRRKKQHTRPGRGIASPPAVPTAAAGPHRLRHLLLRAAAVALVLGAAGLAIWYALAPPMPEVSLGAGADPALVRAVDEARWAIRRAPYSDGPRGRFGMLLQAHALRAEAAVCYVQAEHLNPAEPRWPYLHALMMAADPPAALELWRRAAELAGARPNAADAALLHLADASLGQGRLDEAATAYRQLLRGRPDHARARLGLARLALRRGRPAEALEHLGPCAASPATRKAARQLAAQAHRRLGNADAAATAAREAAELPPDAAWPDPWSDEVVALRVGREARVMRLQELRAHKRLAEAAELARQTVADYPDLGWLELGRSRLAASEWDAAERALQEALRLAPHSAEARFGLGQALVGQKKYQAAAEALRAVIAQEPAHAAAYRELARCLAATGDKQGATHMLEQALRLRPQCADSHRELGELLAEAGRRDEGVQHLDQAVRLNPDDARARELLASARGKDKP